MGSLPDIGALEIGPAYDDVLGHISTVEEVSEDTSAILVAIENEASGEGRSDVIEALARAGRLNISRVNEASNAIEAYCRAAEAAHKAYEKLNAAVAAGGDLEDSKALRDLSRDMAGMIANITRPAFKAITEMQNKAVEIDAMVQRARDMAGCLRWLHGPDRDPERPEFNSLAATVGETMDPRTIAFSAAVQRARAGLSGDAGTTFQDQYRDYRLRKTRERRIRESEAGDA